jgi:flagellar motor switch protein FliN/FliY
MNTFLDCWIGVSSSLFHQALAGEPDLTESQSGMPMADSFGYVITLAGDEEGRFSVWLDSSILGEPLLGEGVEQKASWAELVRETFDAACGDLFAKTGKKCRIEKLEESDTEDSFTHAFQIQSGQRNWKVLVRDALIAKGNELTNARKLEARMRSAESAPSLSPGLELLLDVELEASLRFGCREMPLGEILDLGPGDVVQLDRHVADPVDLIVGDKIVARGEVVLVNGNFGLRISEVAAPKKRLESIRCLF